MATHVHHSSYGAEPYPNYPPQPNTDYYNPPPPVIDPHRPPTHDFHYSTETPAYPPPPRADPYPSGSNVHHVSHESGGENKPHHFSPTSFIHNHTHHQGPDVLNQKPTFRLYSKAETNYSLTIRDGKVILAPSNPSDPFQHWIKDEKFSTKVKDEQGFPSFALVNEATGQAMKHSIGATHPVQLIHYNPDKLDESVLWTLSKDLGDGYRTIRMVNNIRLNVDAFNGDANHGGVRDGTTIVLWEWKKGENQRWKIIPYCKSLNHINSVIEFPGKGFLRVQCVLVAIFGNTKSLGACH